ncbi:MAG: hypothetical protein WC465_02395 [Patescibacteria group bacterium]
MSRCSNTSRPSPDKNKKQYYNVYVDAQGQEVFVANLWARSKTQAEGLGEGLRRRNPRRYPRGPIRARLAR